MPSAKRSRQRAQRAARQAQLQRAQQRRQRNRRAIIGVVLATLLVLVGVLATTLSTSGSSKSSTSGSSTTSATTAASTSSTSAAAKGPALKTYAAPAVSASCNTPATGSGTQVSAATGKQVAIIQAPANVPFPKPDGSSPHYTKFSSAPPFCLDVSKTYTATMVTDAGAITINLLTKNAPQTVNNFVFLAGYHFYDGITFHRVIPQFMDQVGDPTGTGSSGPGYTIPDEYPGSQAAYPPGAVAMANTGSPHSGGSQIFLMATGSTGLPPQYTVFGQVTQGLSIVNKINADGSQAGTPNVYHKIISVSIAES